VWRALHHAQSNGQGGSNQRCSARRTAGVSVAGDGGSWGERVPIGKRAASSIGVIQTVAVPRACSNVRKPRARTHSVAWWWNLPRARLEVIPAEFLLELLIALLHLSARFHKLTASSRAGVATEQFRCAGPRLECHRKESFKCVPFSRNRKPDTVTASTPDDSDHRRIGIRQACPCRHRH